ncbi:hypothetical protein H4R18_002737 [Coemansia javaensis]|uniref:Uncharacterized protein n=1 Tax=Coemansia javaensis TaxID=2761396 RepID=A0A9W8HAZ4_9FUNG|nr:hypothetical protein H4R18_002737 [Coemansia javaensis]
MPRTGGRPAERRFREIHYHRFPLGVRSNVHGTCMLRSHLPVRLPRPHTMQMIYRYPPPGIGHRRGTPEHWTALRGTPGAAQAALDLCHAAVREIRDERRRVAHWLATGRAIARTHVVVATQTGLQFFVAGFGYWNVLDVDLELKNEACVGVKAFEVRYPHAPATTPEADADADAASDEADPECGAENHQLPVLIIALTTYVKQPAAAGPGLPAEEQGTYRLYALGQTSLPPLPRDFVERHALAKQGETVEKKDPPGEQDEAAEKKDVPAEQAQPAEEKDPLAARRGAPDIEADDPLRSLPVNSYAYLEERLLALRIDHDTLCLDLDYLPFRISQDVVDGMPPVLLVAGNDNRVHRYALGCDRIVEIEPLLCPKTDMPLTFTAYDARVVGPLHVQVTAHQEFTMALHVSRALSAVEEEACGAPPHSRRLLVADEETYDAAPILATVFTPDIRRIDRTAFDYTVARRVGSSRVGAPLAVGEIYDPGWPIGAMGRFPLPRGIGRDGDGAGTQQEPRMHVLLGFVGEDAIVYHDVAEVGLDPAPTLVGGVAGRLDGRGGVFSLPGSSRDGMVTSVHFDDLDFDGTKEVVIGTTAGSVMIYKEVPARGYVLVWSRRFPAPVYGIFSADINSDGANELVVVTLLGVHIMQPNLAHARAKLLRQLVLVAENNSQSVHA